MLGLTPSQRSLAVLRCAYDPTPMAADVYRALGAQEGWQQDELYAADGRVVRGIVRKPHRDIAPWVVFFGANGPGLLEQAQRFMQRFGGDRDIGLAAYAYRGFDVSEGTPSRRAFYEDAERVTWHLAARFGVLRSRMHVVGFSMGSHIALRLTAHGGQRGRPFASVALLAPFATMEIGRSGWMGRLLPAERYETLPLLADFTTATLIVHGQADAALPIEQGRAVASAIGKAARMVEIQGVGHSELLEHPTAIDELRHFLPG